MTAQTPGQADGIPDAYARFCRLAWAEAPDSLIAALWREKTPAEREFWRSLDAPRQPQPASEVPADGAVVLRACEGTTLVVAFGPATDPERAVKVTRELREVSGMEVIAVAGVAAVKAHHPHDEPARQPQPAVGESAECEACGLHRPPVSAERAAPGLAAAAAENERLRGWLLGIMRGNGAEIGAARMQADDWITKEGL